ncbi:ABC transporter permease [Asticcacaulis sp.]|uniref:ABC transporter permease n=1 Tax=Asticcacaulis sp. TaxID=1872648 RepID=UPI002627A30D|nr:ABC transporter permease [Asticcacaulis sp.]
MSSDFNKAGKDLRNGLKLYKVWFHQAYHGISSKYKNTALGSLWIAGSMVATSLSLSLVFGLIMGQNLHEVLPRIMAGILVYGLVGYVLGEAVEIFLGAAGTIKNHAYPFTFYVFENVTRSVLIFLHNLIVFFFALVCVQNFKVPHWSVLLGLPIVIVTILSWGCVMGMLAARFRDLRFLMPYISQLVFFVTPIFWYPAGKVEGWRKVIIDYNPFFGLVEVIRDPLLGNAPPMHLWVLALVTMISGLLVSALVFPPLRRRIPFWV